jgi:hypothetical protein
MQVMRVGEMETASKRKRSAGPNNNNDDVAKSKAKQSKKRDWRDSSKWKNLIFGILGLMLVASIANNFVAFHFKQILPCDLYVYLAISNVVLFILQQTLSAYIHPASVSSATAPVPPAVPHSWRGRLGRVLMLGVEFLTNKLGASVLCIHLGFLLHLFVLSPAEGRLEMAVLDPKLGQPLPEKDYGNGCDDLSQVHVTSKRTCVRMKRVRAREGWELTGVWVVLWQVYDSLYDFFVFVHFTGFMLMAGSMRSFAMRTTTLFLSLPLPQVDSRLCAACTDIVSSAPPQRLPLACSMSSSSSLFNTSSPTSVRYTSFPRFTLLR